MYFPYVRAKREEVFALREVSDLIGQASIIPIIEPVKASALSFRQMADTIQSIVNNGGDVIIITNPKVGDLVHNTAPIITMINAQFATSNQVLLGVIVDSNTPAATVQGLVNTFGSHRVAAIHKAPSNMPNVTTVCNVAYNIFLAGKVSQNYINAFQTNKVIISDGFERMNNADYDPDNFYSDTHLTFLNNGFNGFGDYQMVGGPYQLGGGPAYAVALHLAYFQNNSPQNMHYKHFISTTNASAQNPGGKFAEALLSLVTHFNSPQNVLENTRGVQEYLNLHRTGHYPGLGKPKRFSIMHHIEIMANRFP